MKKQEKQQPTEELACLSFIRIFLLRYPPRDGYNVPPPYMAKNEMPPVHRRYEDVAPPGTEPPVPGMEPSPQSEEKYQYSSPIHEYRDREANRHEKDDRKDRHHR